VLDAWEKAVNILGVNASSSGHDSLIMIADVIVTPINKWMDLFSWAAHKLVNLDMAN